MSSQELNFGRYQAMDEQRLHMSPTPDFVIQNYNPHYDYSNKNINGMSDSRGALIKLNKMLPDDS